MQIQREVGSLQPGEDFRQNSIMLLLWSWISVPQTVGNKIMLFKRHLVYYYYFFLHSSPNGLRHPVKIVFIMKIKWRIFRQNQSLENQLTAELIIRNVLVSSSGRRKIIWDRISDLHRDLCALGKENRWVNRKDIIFLPLNSLKDI